MADPFLCQAVREIKNGCYEADLGGGLLKKRVARPGRGKRGGFPTIVASNKNTPWFFVFGFSKNVRDNIDEVEKDSLKKLSSYLLSLPVSSLDLVLKAGEVLEIRCDA